MRILDPIKGFLRLPNSGDKHGTPPGPLPGRFFVLTWERDDQTFILHVDDEDKSTYDLGDDINEIRLAFRLRGYAQRTIDEWIDRAREFGAAQYIPTPGQHVPDRVIQLLPRDPNQGQLQFPQDDHDDSFQHLR